METPTMAPPVVTVVVTRDPGEWFEDALAALRAQDYPNLSVLVLDAGSVEDPTGRVAGVLPGAYVRRLPDYSGFAAVANHVFTIVKDAAYFVFCHDDVAPSPDAVRLLVEEALRSNAGIVGPKLVDWHHPERIVDVGLTADKVAYPAPLADRHELDQEQYDAVRDVFAVPSGLTLVRSDLFTSLGGFDPAMGGHGEDVDLCWRAQIAGARVLVAPAARARHLGDGVERRWEGDDDATTLDHRHRLRAVLKNYSLFHLLRVLPQAAVTTLLEAIVALVGGNPGRAGAPLKAWSWNLRQLGELRRLRRAVRRSRMVPDRDVRRLQVAGSAHLTAYVRGQLVTPDRVSPLTTAGRNFLSALRSRAGLTVLTVMVAATLVLLVGSRHLIGERVAAVGELTRFTEGPGTLLRHYLSGWNPTGVGSEAPPPAGFATLGLGGVLLFGNMGLLRTLLVLGAWPMAALGVWRLTRPLSSARARAVAVVVTLAVPLPYNALARGRWSGLVAYAIAPWVLNRLLSATQTAPFGGARPRQSEGAVALRAALGLGVLVALAGSLAPSVALTLVVAAAGLALGSVLAFDVRRAGRPLLLALGGLVVAGVLLVPWTFDLLEPGTVWSSFTGTGTAPHNAPSLGDLLRFETGPLGAPPIGWAFLAAGALPLLIGGGWRLEWATRCWAVALTCVAVAWAAGRGWLPSPLRSPEVVLAPAAVALAIAAALGVVAFQVDLRKYRFGLPQLALVLSAVAVAVSVLPVFAAATDGRWNLPATDLDRALGWMRSERSAGAFRVLWLGDGDVLPLGGWSLGTDDDDGTAFATSNDGPPDVSGRWPSSHSRGTRLIGEAVRVAERGDTTRLGHLLAPMAVRYIVVPQRVAPATTGAPLVKAPARLLAALQAQIDLRQLPSDPDLLVYQSTAWGPGRAEVPQAVGPVPRTWTGRGADLSAARPVLPGRLVQRVVGPLEGSSNVLVSEGSSDRWELKVAGTEAERQQSFGWANSFTVDSGGRAVLRHRTRPSRYVWVLAQLALWVAALWALSRFRRASRRAPLVAVASERS